jgi:hypothetical protein
MQAAVIGQFLGWHLIKSVTYMVCVAKTASAQAYQSSSIVLVSKASK